MQRADRPIRGHDGVQPLRLRQRLVAEVRDHRVQRRVSRAHPVDGGCDGLFR